ncbi:MAG: TetR/AcrR family transcriptional regulator [Clostridia bacterium]|nr:TetR/AcrR family transcriptional regulator [Clostridia bacterium]
MKKQNKLNKTEKALINGIVDLMKEKKLSDITVTELAEHIDMHRCTFYLHFMDIKDLVEHIERKVLNELYKILDKYPNLSTQNNFSQVFGEILSIISENKEICIALIGKNGDPDFMDRINNTLNEYIKTKGWLNNYPNIKEFEYEYYYTFISAGLISILQKWILNDMKDDPILIAKLLEKICLKGLESLK